MQWRQNRGRIGKDLVGRIEEIASFQNLRRARCLGPLGHHPHVHQRRVVKPLPETFHKTLLEVKRCTREHIVINTFMLESNHHLVQFVNQVTRLNRGRAFFISPDRLGDYVLVEYVASKHRAA